MPLTISLKLGQDFYVDDERFIVTSIESESRFQVLRVSTGQSFDISPDLEAEVLDNVFVNGARRRKPPSAKVAVFASQAMRIKRGHMS